MPSFCGWPIWSGNTSRITKPLKIAPELCSGGPYSIRGGDSIWMDNLSPARGLALFMMSVWYGSLSLVDGECEGSCLTALLMPEKSLVNEGMG
ncbi:hypothetical protein OGATHE_006142 [Ogataea polymorpha]|uniref:Uncharacterized protein n=1 Tax=Ogataea polymorpha TaxID=460523 RepID=A0A9P8NR57_9ASCO|nr:hypothetical protein OGATHE_006142 [Ogataea polymorpha]